MLFDRAHRNDDHRVGLGDLLLVCHPVHRGDAKIPAHDQTTTKKRPALLPAAGSRTAIALSIFTL